MYLIKIDLVVGIIELDCKFIAVAEASEKNASKILRASAIGTFSVTYKRDDIGIVFLEHRENKLQEGSVLVPARSRCL